MSSSDAVREMHIAGTVRWPSIHVTFEEFRIHFERAVLSKQLGVEYCRYPADFYLCCACAAGDRIALGVFEQQASELVRGVVARMCRDKDMVCETLQEFWNKVLVGPEARVRDYTGSGPLLAWLQVAATRAALDRLRKQRGASSRETELEESFVDQAFGPETMLVLAKYRQPFREALRQAIARLSPKERNLLRMHVAGRCTIDQIGRVYNVHRATAARWLERAKLEVIRSVRAELAISGPMLTDSEFQSIVRVVGSELDVGVSVLQTNVPLQNPATTG
ncbi:MAG TPA: sigma-70 family RNA polymerase sigma factor [Polyangiaceae bacterium]